MSAFSLEVVNPAALLLLLLIPVFVGLWLRWPPPYRPWRNRFALGLRLFLVVALVMSLAGMRVSVQPQRRAVIAVVDLSASMRANIDQERTAVQQLAAAKGVDDLFGVVTFGEDAQVEMPPTANPQFTDFQVPVKTGHTDVAKALELAADIVPSGYARQLVLLSDGRENLGDAALEVQALHESGVRVDVLPMGAPVADESLVTSVDAPAQARTGDAIAVDVQLRSSQGASGTLTLSVDGHEVETREVALPAGASTQSFRVAPLPAGLHRVRAELTATPDTYSENNVGEAAVRVVGPAVVLVLEGSSGAGSNMVKALTAAGMVVDLRSASAAPSDPAVIARYDAVVVVDASADQLGSAGMTALQKSVHDLGRGLVTIGGPSSYGPGGWQGTPLEAALPVTSDLPNRKEKPKVAVVLVMETMEDPQADRVALSAAEAVIDKLTPEDEVAVTGGGSGYGGGGSVFIVPMQAVTDKKKIDSELEAASLGDPPTYLPYIQSAGDALLKTDAPLKHIVVLGDGDAEFVGGDYQGTLGSLHGKGVTTSAVGIDTHSSTQFMSFMSDIARWGGGNFYQSNNPNDVPQLFLKEEQVALRPWFEQDPFFPRVTSAGDLLSGVALNAFPELGGYVVTTPRPSADVYFTSAKDDPVLAAWQYGLGRSVAWTSDAQGIWTSGLLSSAVGGQLFARMVQWTLPSGTGGGLSIDAVPAGTGLEVTVNGADISGASLSMTALTPSLGSASVSLRSAGPGRWEGSLPADEVGTYVLHAVLSRGSTTVASGELAASVPYSAEFLELGPDLGFLKLLAREGGVLLSSAPSAWKQPALAQLVSSDIFWPLLLLAVVLWPVDVAFRRLNLSGRQALELLRDVVRLRRPSVVEVAAPEEIVRLRERLRPLRSRRVEAAPPPPVAGPQHPTAESEDQVEEAQDTESLSSKLLDARRRRRN